MERNSYWIKRNLQDRQISTDRKSDRAITVESLRRLINRQSMPVWVTSGAKGQMSFLGRGKCPPLFFGRGKYPALFTGENVNPLFLGGTNDRGREGVGKFPGNGRSPQWTIVNKAGSGKFESGMVGWLVIGQKPLLSEPNPVNRGYHTWTEII